MSRRLGTLAALMLVLALAPAGELLAQKRTQSIRPAVFEQMEQVQQALDEGAYEKAEAVLDKIAEHEDSLNDYERATLYNLYAQSYYERDQTEKAIEAYVKVLQQEKLPEGMRNSTLFAIAQSYFLLERYDRAIKVLDRWFELAEDPSPDAYVLLAQAHYQLEDYGRAQQVLLRALRSARDQDQPIKENWLGLLRAVLYEQENYAKAARVLELLIKRFPKEDYYIQLSGMYGLMGDRRKQLAVLHAAAVGGMLSDESNMVNLARLYLVEDAPFPAVQILTRGFKDGIIDADAENLQLYAQALGFAKEYDTQVKVLERLAEKTGAARHYVFLGQGLAELGRFTEAAEAFARALATGETRQPGRVHMQRGTALFNAGQLEQARQAFRQALAYEDTASNAENWLTHVEREMQRRQALEQAG